MVASFQNPEWVDLGVLGSFGRWMGINWVWAVELTIYHSIVSITIPVLLVELIFPMEKTRSWLHGRWRRILPFLFITDVVVGFFLFKQFTGFTPPILQYSFFIILSGLFLYWAYILPPGWARNGSSAMRRPRFYFLVAFLGSIACGFIFGVLPERLNFVGAPFIVIVLGVTVLLAVIRVLISYDRGQATSLHYHRLLFGSLFIFTATRLGATSALLAAPFFWVSIEFLRSNMFFLALPWGLLAHSQYLHPAVIQIASITSAYGVSFLIVLINSVVTAVILPMVIKVTKSRLAFPKTSWNRQTLKFAGSTCVITAITLLYGYFTLSKPIEGEEITVSLVQPNIEQKKKWNPKSMPRFQKLKNISKRNPKRWQSILWKSCWIGG